MTYTSFQRKKNTGWKPVFFCVFLKPEKGTQGMSPQKQPITVYAGNPTSAHKSHKKYPKKKHMYPNNWSTYHGQAKITKWIFRGWLKPPPIKWEILWCTRKTKIGREESLHYSITKITKCCSEFNPRKWWITWCEKSWFTSCVVN